jgi:hypothetical protein
MMSSTDFLDEVERPEASSWERVLKEFQQRISLNPRQREPSPIVKRGRRNLAKNTLKR